jgi:NAD(P)H dehydrogenase (quinone)
MSHTIKKILVIIGHPNPQSFNHALAAQYAEAARAAGHEVTVLALNELRFDPILRLGYAGEQALEPDLQRAQAAILRAEHIVIVFPSWWGSMPALLKGFIDRTLLPGFAFKYRSRDTPWWDQLLKGRTGRILLTMDTPWWYNRLVYGNANINMLKAATLQFCGIKKVKVSTFGGVRLSKPATRMRWLEQVAQLGRKGA